MVFFFFQSIKYKFNYIKVVSSGGVVFGESGCGSVDTQDTEKKFELIKEKFYQFPMKDVFNRDKIVHFIATS